MLNTVSLDTVARAKFSHKFTRPCYESYCFSNLPATLLFLLTGQGQSALPLDVFGKLPTRYNKVVLFFLDGFGWRFFERYAEKYRFLKTIMTRGVASKLTSQFPSTTAAHVTCIHTGLDVGQSGVYEWNYYEPLVDEIISPLPFSYAGHKLLRDTIKRSAIAPAPSLFFPRQTLYQTLQAQGVTSHIVQSIDYASSTYSDIVFRGANVHPYRSLQDALTQMVELLTAPETGPAYYFLYFDRLDTTSHNHGPNARQVEEVIDHCFTQMERTFYRNIQGKVNDTLILITADHGQVEVNPRSTYYLNQQMPDITRYFKKNRRGQPLVPAGSARDMFLHVLDDHVDWIVADLRRNLHGRAEVYPTQQLLAQHFFGIQEPSTVFLQRVGNVVILPYKEETVWWYEEDRFAMHFLGHHGGLTPEEMEIPLLALAL
jgi:hypothetical protein